MAPSSNLRSSRRRQERAVPPDDQYEESSADDSSSDSESEFEPAIFVGLTMSQLQGKSERRGRAIWPEDLKTVIFKMAINLGFSAKNLPTPEVLLELCTQIGLPLNRGKRVAAACLKKLVAWIENNVPPKVAAELIAYKMVARYNKPAWEIQVSAALTEAVKRDNFSFSRDILGGVVRSEHATLGYNHYEVLHPSTIGSATLQQNTMALLMTQGRITKESEDQRGTRNAFNVANAANGRVNAAPGLQQAVPGVVTLSPYAAHHVGQTYPSAAPAPGLSNSVAGPWWAIPHSASYGPGYGLPSARTSFDTRNDVSGFSPVNLQSAAYGSGFGSSSTGHADGRPNGVSASPYAIVQSSSYGSGLTSAPAASSYRLPNGAAHPSRATHRATAHGSGHGYASAAPASGYSNAVPGANSPYVASASGTPTPAPRQSHDDHTPTNRPSYATPRSHQPNETDARAPAPTTQGAPRPSGYDVKTPNNNHTQPIVSAHGNSPLTPPPSGSRYGSPTPAAKSAEFEELLHLRKLVAKLGLDKVKQETVAGPSGAPQTTPYLVDVGGSDDTDQDWSSPPHYLQQVSHAGTAGSMPEFRDSTPVMTAPPFHQMQAQSMHQNVPRTPDHPNESLATTFASFPNVPAQDPGYVAYASPPAARALEPAYLADNRPSNQNRPPTAFSNIAQPVPTTSQAGSSSYSHMPGQYEFGRPPTSHSYIPGHYGSRGHPPTSQQLPPYFPSGSNYH